MTLPTSAPITLGDVLTEIQRVNPSRALPISLGDADVRALADKPSGPVSLSDLYGKSSYIPMTITPQPGYGVANTTASAGIVHCYPAITISGGSGGVTTSWTFVSNPSGCVLSAGNYPNCDVSHTYAKLSNGMADATVRATVTDDTGHTVTCDVPANLEWFSTV